MTCSLRLPILAHENMVVKMKWLPRGQMMIQHESDPKRTTVMPLNHLQQGRPLENRNKVHQPPHENLYQTAQAGMSILRDKNPLTVHHKKSLLSMKQRSEL